MVFVMSENKSQLHKFAGYINTEHSDRKFYLEEDGMIQFHSLTLA